MIIHKRSFMNERAVGNRCQLGVSTSKSALPVGTGACLIQYYFNQYYNQMVYCVLQHKCWIKIQEILMNTYANIKLVKIASIVKTTCISIYGLFICLLFICLFTWDHTSVPARWHLIPSIGFSRAHECDRRHTDGQ